MTQKFNNEKIGISAEIAIADAFNIVVDNRYRTRGDKEIITLLQRDILNIFFEENIQITTKHDAEGQNHIEFILENVEKL